MCGHLMCVVLSPLVSSHILLISIPWSAALFRVIPYCSAMRSSRLMSMRCNDVVLSLVSRLTVHDMVVFYVLIPYCSAVRSTTVLHCLSLVAVWYLLSLFVSCHAWSCASSTYSAVRCGAMCLYVSVCVLLALLVPSHSPHNALFCCLCLCHADVMWRIGCVV